MPKGARIDAFLDSLKNQHQHLNDEESSSGLGSSGSPAEMSDGHCSSNNCAEKDSGHDDDGKLSDLNHLKQFNEEFLSQLKQRLRSNEVCRYFYFLIEEFLLICFNCFCLRLGSH